MKTRSEASLVGVVVYDGVEPIDIGGTIGVISMATRILPGLRYVVIAERKGPVRLASGLTILAGNDFDDAPDCDVTIVTGGPGWRDQAKNTAMLNFLRGRAIHSIGSVCTGALILAASGQLAGKTATTRRKAVGDETTSPLDMLGKGYDLIAREAALIDDEGLVTSGGVTLAIDGMIYVLGRLYGDHVRDEIASIIEYDRAYAANRNALGHLKFGATHHRAGE